MTNPRPTFFSSNYVPARNLLCQKPCFRSIRSQGISIAISNLGIWVVRPQRCHFWNIPSKCPFLFMCRDISPSHWFLWFLHLYHLMRDWSDVISNPAHSFPSCIIELMLLPYIFISQSSQHPLSIPRLDLDLHFPMGPWLCLVSDYKRNYAAFQFLHVTSAWVLLRSWKNPLEWLGFGGNVSLTTWQILYPLRISALWIIWLTNFWVYSRS